jgi:hypothetical protein
MATFMEGGEHTMMQRAPFTEPFLFCKAVTDYAPSFSGIYMLLGPNDGRGNHAIFYVGQANDIQRRLREHLNENTKERAVFYVYFPEGNQLRRNVLERQLIEKYKPLYNKTLNPARTLKPNRITPVPSLKKQAVGLLEFLEQEKRKEDARRAGILAELFKKKI